MKFNEHDAVPGLTELWPHHGACYRDAWSAPVIRRNGACYVAISVAAYIANERRPRAILWYGGARSVARPHVKWGPGGRRVYVQLCRELWDSVKPGDWDHRSKREADAHAARVGSWEAINELIPAEVTNAEAV